MLSAERTRRDLDEGSNYCKKLQYGNITAGMDAESDLNSIPFVNAPAVGVSYASHMAKGGSDLAMLKHNCDDATYEELKVWLNIQLNELNRQSREHYTVLKNIYRVATMTLKTAVKIKTEMNEDFNKVLQSIKHPEIENTIIKINNIVEYFDEERKHVDALPTPDYINKIEQKNLFQYLKYTISAENDSLRSILFKIIENEYALPLNREDIVSIKTFYSLFNGIQAFESVMQFLMKTQSFLSNYYYKKGNLDKYNMHFSNIIPAFQDFKSFLVVKDKTSKKSLLHKVYDVVKAVKMRKIELKLNSKTDLIEKFSFTIQRIKNMQLPVLTEIPENNIKVSFKKSETQTPFQNWKSGNKVSYAVQYRHKGKYSRVSEWSTAYEVKDKAHPILIFQKEPNTYDRIIFRRFNNDTPQIIGKVGSNAVEFRDIHRDLYDVAEIANEEEEEAREKVLFLFKNGAQPSYAFEMGKTALHAAVKHGNTRIANDLYSSSDFQNVDIQDEEGYSPLIRASLVGKVDFVEKMLNLGADVHLKTHNEEMTALQIAAREGFTDVIKKLFSFPCRSMVCRIDCLDQDSDLYTPMHHAVQGGTEVIKVLINNKCDYNSKSRSGLTPLHLSIMKNDIDITKFLLGQNGIQVNSGDIENRTPLHYAAMLGYIDAVQSLIEQRNIDVNAKTTSEKWTPLHFAVFFKRKDIVQKLLTVREISVDEPDLSGNTPLHLAVKAADVEIASILLSEEANIHQKAFNGYTALHFASLHENSNMASFLLDRGAKVNSKSETNNTPLHFAAEEGRLKTVKLLIQKGADVKAISNLGYNPLDSAVVEGKLNIVMFLSRKGAKISGPDSYYTAIEKGHMDVVQFLIQSGKIKLNVENCYEVYGKKTILSTSSCRAVNSGHLDMVKYFIGEWKGCGCNEPYYGVFYNQLNVLKYFVEELNQTVENCTTLCVCKAIENRNTDMVKYLLSKGVQVNGKEEGRTPLSCAIDYGATDIVKLLVKNKADVTYKNNNGENILFMAYLQASTIEYLVHSTYLNIDARNKEGNTVLHVAAAHPYAAVQTIEVLCSLGADRTIKNNKNERPYDIAKKIEKKTGMKITDCLKPASGKRSVKIKVENSELSEINMKKAFFQENIDKIEVLNISPQTIPFPKVKYIKGSSNSSENFAGQKQLESLLLLDVLIRKKTGEKYNIPSENSISELDAKALALKIVDEYQEFLRGTDNKFPVEEHVDLYQVYQKVFKLIMSGNKSKIWNILKQKMTV